MINFIADEGTFQEWFFVHDKWTVQMEVFGIILEGLGMIIYNP